MDQPPATAGMIDTVIPSPTLVSRPSRYRTSSSSTKMLTNLRSAPSSSSRRSPRPGMRRLERGDHVAERAGLDRDLLLAAREGAHRGGDSNGHSHGRHATGRNSLPDRSGFAASRRRPLASRERARSARSSRLPTSSRARRRLREVARGHRPRLLGARHRLRRGADGRRRRRDPRRARRTEPHLGRHRPARRSVEAQWRLAEGHRRDRDGPGQRAGARRRRRARTSALDATTTGTGELIDHALDAGARRIIVGPRRVGDHRRRLRRRAGDHRDRLGSSRSNCSSRAT